MARSLTKPIEHIPECDAETKEIRIRRRGKVAIGFREDPEDSRFMISIPKEIVALRYLYGASKNLNYSYSQLAQWFKAATGRNINISEISRMRNEKHIPLALKLLNVGPKGG